MSQSCLLLRTDDNYCNFYYFLKLRFGQITPVGLVVLLQLLQKVPDFVVGEGEAHLVQHALHLGEGDAGLAWQRVLPGGVQRLLKFCLCGHFSGRKTIKGLRWVTFLLLPAS